MNSFSQEVPIADIYRGCVHSDGGTIKINIRKSRAMIILGKRTDKDQLGVGSFIVDGCKM